MKIAHIHVADQNNKGDVAIVLAIQDMLRQTFPDCQILDYPMEILKKATQQQIRQINQSDLVVVGGGGIFYSYFTPFNTDIIRQIKTPIVIFGVGHIREIGAPDLSDQAWNSIIFLVNQAKLVSVRENFTANKLIEKGISPEKISIIGDPAVLLEEIPNHSIPLDYPVKIGLNLNYSGWMGFGQYQNEIISTYQQVISYFQDNYNAGIYYLQHHPGESQIYPTIQTKNFHLVNLPPKQQKWIYGQLDLVIGMMLHSVVMTFGANTPFVCIGYDLRCQTFTDFINQPQLHIPATQLNPKDALEIIKNTFNNREKIKTQFSQTQKNIQEQHQIFLDRIRKLTK